MAKSGEHEILSRTRSGIACIDIILLDVLLDGSLYDFDGALGQREFRDAQRVHVCMSGERLFTIRHRPKR
jgi:hypothetical protein